MNYIGVDGCKAGWFYVSLDDSNNWETGIFPDIQSLIEKFHGECLILVDIPIGLRHKGNLERLCDKEARKNLGNRKASVFPAPCRKAVYENTYEKASLINYKLTGRKLSKLSWFISNKIKQVDDLLTNPLAPQKLREVHPEICFWGLNERKSMKYYKKTPEGFDERLDVIRNVYKECDELVEEVLSKYKRYEVAKDDVLDALIGAVTARFGFNSLKTIPVAPEYDEKGLPMEMIYCTNEPVSSVVLKPSPRK